MSQQGKDQSIEADNRVSYSSYLKVDELVSLQQPLSEPTAHDELLFIVIHQSYELWFKLVLFELDSFVNLVFERKEVDALRRLERVHEVFRVLVQKVDILETMTPVEFNRFRSHLNPASGFQSWQFREIELLAGGEIAENTKMLKLDPEWKDRIDRRLSLPTLREALIALLQNHAGLEPHPLPSAIQAAALRLYTTSEFGSLPLSICEGLIRLDENLQLWRYRHVQMVERMIGMKMGTGSSLGVKYLQSTLTKRFFPELWALRTSLT